jgi:class 3 adenylate cyclase/tetratricopeptide (TPR) repeat protein
MLSNERDLSRHQHWGEKVVTFDEVLEQVLELLRRRGRVSYRALKVQFQLDDDLLELLRDEIVEVHHLARDQEGKMLVWSGDAAAVSSGLPAMADQEHAQLTHTPPHLAEKIRTARRALQDERKQVTVLFADLKGSTELLLADRDPEEARQLLDPVLERMIEAVHRYEGTVNQVMGDGIMALFGAPLAHEDHAARACYAALRMQESVTRYGDELQRSHGVPVQIRVGLHSGAVVVRAIDSSLHMDYTAVGQTTVLAARMEQMAKPGSVLMTVETLRLAEGSVQVRPLGPVPVKGLAQPVEVFELVGAMPSRTRLQAAASRGLPRFVGRQAELAALRQALERTGTGHGQVVAVVGEPGMGKTRLFYEFTHAHRTPGWLLLESHPTSYGKATPYLPVRDLLKVYFETDDRDAAHAIREKVTGKLLTLDAALGPALPALLTLLDVAVDDPLWQALDPSQRRQRTLEALKRLLLRESQVQPLLMVFENLHWIDAETQGFLDTLVESLPSARVLLLVNYRPEYAHGWGGKTYYTQLRLDPLPPEHAAELLEVLLGDDPGLTPLKHRLLERTEGNPFFLEESIHTLVETGVLEGKRGAYRLEKPLPSIQVPATVQAVLAARIDRLPPDEKALLQAAAVIGTEVPLALLRAIADYRGEPLHLGLTHLQAAEFLYETRLFPEQEYAFKHALTHEVAYGSLLLERRRALHARIVEALEALAPERVVEQVERLAYHALWGAVWAKAVTYCQQAGARAYDRAAFGEAVAAFEQALQALAHLPEDSDTRVLAIELRLALGSPLFRLGEYRRDLALLREVEALARARDDRVRLGRVLAQMAAVLRLTGDLDGAIAAGRQAIELAAEIGESALQAQAAYTLGQVYWATGDFGQAAALLRRSVEAADPEVGTPSTDVRIQSQAWLARILSALGAFAEGRRHGEEALRLATAAGHGNTPIIAHAGLGHLYLAQGDLEHAIRVLEQGLALCRASGNRASFLPMAADLGYATALQGRLVEGLALLEEAIREGVRTGGLQGQASRAVWLSEVCRLAGHGEEASQHARQALDLAWQLKERGNEARALYQLGVVQAHADPPNTEQAEAHYGQALALAGELGMRPLMAHCHLGLGKLYADIGRRAEAHAELSAAIGLYRAMEMTFWLPQAEVALAQLGAR